MLRWFAIINIFILTACSSQSKKFKIEGNTQGTTYHITYITDQEILNKSEIDSLLHEFDLALSSYIDNSVISQINNAKEEITIEDKSGFFKKCYLLSQEVYTISNHAFEPSLFPVIEAHGFYKENGSFPDSLQISQAKKHVSFAENDLFTINFKNDFIQIIKKDSLLKFDFNAIAQGLAVDVIHDFILKKGIKNLYVEIGGELRVSGKNHEGEEWNIGIDSPVAENKTMDGNREVDNIIHFTDKAVATSGSYRKFYEHNGMRYSHTIDPLTAWPVTHNLLSATVIAKNCALADAYATVFMVLGNERTKEFLSKNSGLNLEVLLIFQNDKGKLEHYVSKGFKTYLSESK